MKDNEISLVKEDKFDNSVFTEIDSILYKCFKGCHINNFHKFKYESIYDIQLTKITNEEKINLTISGKNLNLCE